MAFWESMKIWQMGRLLQERENKDVKDVLQQWQNDLLVKKSWKNKDPKKSENSDSDQKHLTEYPGTPTLYFMTFVAILCEKAKQDPDLSMNKIGETYFSNIFSNFEQRGDFLFYLSLKDKNEYTQEEKGAWCWDRIIVYVTDFRKNGINTNTCLDDLLDRILQTNEKAYNEHQEKKFNQVSIKNLKSVMEQYDDHWERLCRTYAAPNPTVEKICSLIEDGGIRQLILTGAPGTGKTYAAREAARLLTTNFKTDFKMVQFHPSYDYTDFVEGLRPVQLEQLEGETKSTKSTFVRLDGSFKDFCRCVAKENEDRQCKQKDRQPLYVFLIDEINRANLSQVFGELMFCLETDKRGEPVQTQYKNLPTYKIDKNKKATLIEDEHDIFSDGFFIPENVVIIGTMNDIDRSVESMDFALRRRFIWHEVKVDEELLETAFQSGNFGGLLHKNAKEVAERVTKLNDEVIKGEKGVSFGLNRHYYISQGQFHLPRLKGETLEELMQFVWDCRIEPLLQEYVRGEAEKDIKEFIKECAKALKVKVKKGDKTHA